MFNISVFHIHTHQGNASESSRKTTVKNKDRIDGFSEECREIGSSVCCSKKVKWVHCKIIKIKWKINVKNLGLNRYVALGCKI